MSWKLNSSGPKLQSCKQTGRDVETRFPPTAELQPLGMDEIGTNAHAPKNTSTQCGWVGTFWAVSQQSTSLPRAAPQEAEASVRYGIDAGAAIPHSNCRERAATASVRLPSWAPPRSPPAAAPAVATITSNPAGIGADATARARALIRRRQHRDADRHRDRPGPVQPLGWCMCSVREHLHGDDGRGPNRDGDFRAAVAPLRVLQRETPQRYHLGSDRGRLRSCEERNGSDSSSPSHRQAPSASSLRRDIFHKVGNGVVARPQNWPTF